MAAVRKKNHVTETETDEYDRKIRGLGDIIWKGKFFKCNEQFTT